MVNRLFILLVTILFDVFVFIYFLFCFLFIRSYFDGNAENYKISLEFISNNFFKVMCCGFFLLLEEHFKRVDSKPENKEKGE